MLQALKSKTLADDVARNLLGYIRRHGLNPGDLLPKEEELAEKLNVSRHIVREGISRLKAYGIVESRKCRGMIVTSPNAFAGVHNLAEAEIFSEEEWKEFLSLRIVMEIGMADFIHAKATKEDIAELRRLAGPPTLQHAVAEEIAFHSKLFSIGGNVIANQFMAALAGSFKYQVKKDFTDLTDLKGKTHQDMCDALENGTKEEFTNIIKAHFKPHTDWLNSDQKGEVILKED